MSLLANSRFAIHEQNWGVVLCPAAAAGAVAGVATTTVTGTVKIASASADPVVPLAAPDNATFRFKDGTHFQLYNPVTGKMVTIWVTGPEGAHQLAFGPGEV